MDTTKKFDKRAFTSTGLLIASIILPVSIFMRHVPAFENSKQYHHLFTSIHSTTGVIFILFFFFHLILNWKVLKKYLSNEKRFLVKKEVFISVTFVLFIIMLFSTWDYFVQ